MPTPTTSAPAPGAAGRGPLRLRLMTAPGSGHLDGGWWPRTRDLPTELADLAGHFPARRGRVTGIHYSTRHWDGAVGGVRVHDAVVLLGSSGGYDGDHVDVRTTDGTTLRLLVVPPDFSDADGEDALLASTTPGNSHSGRDLLETITDEVDVDPSDRWADSGTSWWGDDAAAPSFRPRLDASGTQPGHGR